MIMLHMKRRAQRERHLRDGGVQSVIWPSLIVAPVPQELSLSAPIPMLYDPDLEVKYNMDPH
ncbi:hypothetical protein EDC04DRAFT_2708097 [Pisolithus marmoratus]|nr:hypothetical protein EDC04DRAFT_2708097 [Pisolithus marmoratus]